MKTLLNIFVGIFVTILFTQCTLESFDDTSFLSSIAQPGKVTAIFDITNDNSGDVTITPGGEGVGSYDIYFGDGTEKPATVVSGGKVTHKYAEGDYTVKVVANSIDGKSAEQTYPLKVTYRVPENLEVKIAKTGYKIDVSAKALYANSYLVYFGDKPNEVGTPLAKDATISHTYVAPGKYDVKVVALSGGAATTEKITEVVITDTFELPIDFENPNVNYFFGTFGGASFESAVANPAPGGIDASAKVGKYIKNTGAQVWSGTYSPMDLPIDFSKGNKIKMMVYADPALVGKKINVELEYAVGGTPANGVAVLKMPITKGNTWEELTFDFSTNANIPATSKFTQLVLRFNDAEKGNGEVFYIDNIRITF